MTKNKGKGGKNRRRGKNDSEGVKRELIFREEGQGKFATRGQIFVVYGQVLKMLGNARIEALCYDGLKRQCHIRGKMRKKVWVNTGDIVLIALRDYQVEKGDVILRYNPDEARELKARGEIPDSAKINETDICTGYESGGEDEIEFCDQGIDIEAI